MRKYFIFEEITVFSIFPFFLYQRKTFVDARYKDKDSNRVLSVDQTVSLLLAVRPYFSVRDELALEGGVIKKGYKAVILASLQLQA